MTTTTSTPAGLGSGGRALWEAVTGERSLDVVQEVTLTEACRAKDRLDDLDKSLQGPASTWPASTLAQANMTANMMKLLLASLRLPDEETGKRPQRRGTARGFYLPSASRGAKVSSLDRARDARRP